jgi:excisionase family DNA binding protein
MCRTPVAAGEAEAAKVVGMDDENARSNLNSKNRYPMIEINKQNYYTVFEVAAKMDVHRQTVRLWIRDKKLAAVKIMHRVLISDGALNEFISTEMRQR